MLGHAFQTASQIHDGSKHRDFHLIGRPNFPSHRPAMRHTDPDPEITERIVDLPRDSIERPSNSNRRAAGIQR